MATRCFAGSWDLIEFESQGIVLIYVTDGDIIYNDTVNGHTVGLYGYSSMHETAGS